MRWKDSVTFGVTKPVCDGAPVAAFAGEVTETMPIGASPDVGEVARCAALSMPLF